MSGSQSALEVQSDVPHSPFPPPPSTLMSWFSLHFDELAAHSSHVSWFVPAERYCQLQPLIQVLGVLVGHGPRQSPSQPPLPAVAEGTQPEKTKIVSSPVNGLDAAVLQLEALHTLLLLLPLSEVRNPPPPDHASPGRTLCHESCGQESVA